MNPLPANNAAVPEQRRPCRCVRTFFRLKGVICGSALGSHRAGGSRLAAGWRRVSGAFPPLGESEG